MMLVMTFFLFNFTPVTIVFVCNTLHVKMHWRHLAAINCDNNFFQFAPGPLVASLFEPNEKASIRIEFTTDLIQFLPKVINQRLDVTSGVGSGNRKSVSGKDKRD